MTIKKADTIKALQSKVKGPCPMCGQSNWGADDGIIHLAVSSSATEIQIGGSGIPTVAAVCNHCGFVSLHSAMMLGLIDASGNPTS